jgi:uncharacterized LabA/DUF88 family protein
MCEGLLFPFDKRGVLQCVGLETSSELMCSPLLRGYLPSLEARRGRNWNMIGNYAFIDSQNLHLGIHDLGWKLNYKRFRIYLRDKYRVEKAFLFIGYVAQNSNLYVRLQLYGYICIFKQTLQNKDGKIKGNCDAELVLYAMIELGNYDRAVIVSGDGDFQCLAEYLRSQEKLCAIFVPNQRKYSALFKTDRFKPYLRFVSDLRKKLEMHNKKEPPQELTLEEDIFRS